MLIAGSDVSRANLDLAWSCARLCGVTRLGELTGLDVLGVPVFHAVRPWSRALCVHQGKSLDPLAAKTGALMEAVESHCTEMFNGPTRRAAHAALPSSERAPNADDFARVRGTAPEGAAILWTPAERLAEPGRLWVPWLAVSLDLTRDLGGWVERSSNGSAAGFSFEQARLAGLCELLERDAVSEWYAKPAVSRTLDRLEPPPDAAWLTELTIAAEEADICVSLFGLRSVVGWPIVVCSLEQPDAANPRRTRVTGAACRPDADAALMGAVTEAAQCRLTQIAAVRDDILPGPTRLKLGVSVAPPLPATLRARAFADFREAAVGPAPYSHDAAAALEAAGLGPVACVEVAAPSPAVVMKVFAPGLAGTLRRRRAPLAS